MAERYTLTQADVDGCRKILAQIDELDAALGGFRVGYVNGAQKSATATVHFDKTTDPFTTAAAVTRAVGSLPVLGLLCKKIIAHYETNSAAATAEQQQRALIAETIVEVAQVLRYTLSREPLNIDADADNRLADLVRLVDLYDELEPGVEHG
jgi:hypothetical protein